MCTVDYCPVHTIRIRLLINRLYLGKFLNSFPLFWREKPFNGWCRQMRVLLISSRAEDANLIIRLCIENLYKEIVRYRNTCVAKYVRLRTGV